MKFNFKIRLLVVLSLFMWAPWLAQASVSPDEVISAGRIDSVVRKIGITQALQSSAEGGDASAQYLLSLAYLYESRLYRGSPQFWDTIEKGKAMAFKSAEQGHPKAMYITAHFKTDNPQEQMRLLKSAAGQSYPPAMHDVGLMYFYGHFSNQDHEQNYAQAREYFEQAGQAGSLRSQMRLAAMYFEGLGVSKDTQKAYNLILACAE